MIDVVKAFKWIAHPEQCATLGMSLRDTEKLAMGQAGLSDVGWAGVENLGTIDHCCVTMDGCERSWGASVLIRQGGDPFAPAIPGELPPVLLHRGISNTDDTCSYFEENNQCLFVLELQKL